MKKVVVTGCSRGLGRAMVEGFEKLNYDVFGCSSNSDAIKKLQSGGRFFCCDVADESSVEDFAAQVLADGTAPDILINNAALINQNAPLWEVSDAEFSRLMDVNLRGIANMVRHFVPAMIEKGSGVVVNFSSYWGRSTASEVAPYCASKFGVEGLTSALAQELPRGLAAVALNPGIINTDMLQSCFGSGASAHLGPDQWAESAVPFIDSFDASSNGDSVTVPGQ